MTATITLGGKDFPVAPLTLGQMRQAGPAFMRIGIETPEAMGAQITLLYLAMRSADSKVTPADVDSIPGVTLGEIHNAVSVVAALMGVEFKAVAPGEAKPPEAPAA